MIERLDFKQKKAALEGSSRRYSRMLSSFSYGKIKAYFISRGHRNGVEVFQVNPAYSSVIGRVKFMERYGLTVHQAAALVLARRLLGCSERVPRRRECPDGRGGHVAHFEKGLVASAPETILSAISQRTSNMRLGFAVVLSPIHHPLHVSAKVPCSGQSRYFGPPEQRPCQPGESAALRRPTSWPPLAWRWKIRGA